MNVDDDMPSGEPDGRGLKSTEADPLKAMDLREQIVERKWYFPFLQALRAGAFVFAHFAVVLFFIATIYLIEHTLYAFGDPEIFDAFKWRYLFDAIDVGLIVVFGVMGTLEAIRVFRGKR